MTDGCNKKVYKGKIIYFLNLYEIKVIIILK